MKTERKLVEKIEFARIGLDGGDKWLTVEVYRRGDNPTTPREYTVYGSDVHEYGCVVTDKRAHDIIAGFLTGTTQYSETLDELREAVKDYHSKLEDIENSYCSLVDKLGDNVV